jgi:hypothetical protein
VNSKLAEEIGEGAMIDCCLGYWAQDCVCVAFQIANGLCNRS